MSQLTEIITPSESVFLTKRDPDPETILPGEPIGQTSESRKQKVVKLDREIEVYRYVDPWSQPHEVPENCRNLRWVPRPAKISRSGVVLPGKAIVSPYLEKPKKEGRKAEKGKEEEEEEAPEQEKKQEEKPKKEAPGQEKKQEEAPGQEK